jgi:hypothetical protein
MILEATATLFLSFECSVETTGYRGRFTLDRKDIRVAYMSFYIFKG